MRIMLLASHPDPAGPGTLVTEMVARWRERGAFVTVVDPDDGVVPLDLTSVPEVDLVVLGSGSELALSRAGCLSAAGYAVVHPHRVASACRDKVLQTSLLGRAGLPVPESWVTSDPRRLRPLVHHGPVVVKPARGGHGRGVRVVTETEQLEGVDPPGPWLVMRYHPPEGDDLRCYRIGDEVFAVELGRPAAVDASLRDLVVACGDVLGTEVHGVDVIRSGGRRWVVDVSPFPGFEGVPHAGRRVADLLHDDGVRLAGAAPHPRRPGP